VGFGEAGSAVIAENMKRGGEINPMIPGKKAGCRRFTLNSKL
jgi:hypothetical protein